MYTGLNKNRTNMQNYAIPQDPSDPYLRKWIKPDDNPIIMPDFSMNGSSFRDPTTAWFSKDGHWRMLVGSKRKKRGMAYIYRSRDFKHWVKAKHPPHSKESTGMWECPDLFPVSTTDFRNGLDLNYDGPNIKHVFKVSLDVTRYDYYTLGKYDQADRYVPDGNSPDGWEGLRYDYGNFYASKTFFDYKKNRRILWGWVNESDIAPDDVRKGWAGIQAIPRTVLLDSSKKQLVFWPIEEIESLRGNFVRENNLQISTGQRVEIKGITPAQVDIDVTFNLGSLKNVDMYYPGLTKLEPIELCKVLGSNVIGSIGPFGLITLASPEMEEYTPVFFRVLKDTYNNMTKVLMCSDARRSSLKQDKGPLPHQMMYKPSFGGFVDIDLSDGRISLRTMIDHSVVESFGALGKTVITSRVYPVKNAHLYVFNNGTQTVNVESLNAWSMARPMRMNT